MRLHAVLPVLALAWLTTGPLPAPTRFAIEPYVGGYLTDDEGAFSGRRTELEPRDLRPLFPTPEVESITDPLLSLGGGVAVEMPRTRVRGDLRDHIQLCSGGDGLCEDDEALHNVEIAGGIEIAF